MTFKIFVSDDENIEKTIDRKDSELKRLKDDMNAIELELQHLDEKSSLLTAGGISIHYKVIK